MLIEKYNERHTNKTSLQLVATKCRYTCSDQTSRRNIASVAAITAFVATLVEENCSAVECLRKPMSRWVLPSQLINIAVINALYRRTQNINWMNVTIYILYES